MARTKTKNRGIIEAVVDATEELGEAATNLKESWDHVKHARSRATPATRAAKRAGQNISGALKKGVKKVMPRSSRRTMHRASRTRSKK
ncbi:hypothetical protein KW798_02670 [Candidatus Parcubacteria bacterium]|nr:hypothetical protein [Candidatus Parcubacteria bacterium]